MQALHRIRAQLIKWRTALANEQEILDAIDKHYGEGERQSFVEGTGDEATADLEHLRFGKIPAPGGSIDVSSHCGHRRKLAELIEDRSVADVPGVHYGIHSTQSF